MRMRRRHPPWVGDVACAALAPLRAGVAAALGRRPCRGNDRRKGEDGDLADTGKRACQRAVAAGRIEALPVGKAKNP
jgi:hypothetical protein